MDTDKTPLVYSCLAGHTFEDLPSSDAPVQELELSENPPDGQQEQQEPVAAAAELPPLPLPPAADPGADPPAVEPVQVPERIKAMMVSPQQEPKPEATRRPVDVDKIRAALAKRSAPALPEAVLAEVLRLGVVDVGGGEKLVVVRLPERVAVDVAAQAGEQDFREYFNALMVCAFDFGWFQNLNIQA